MLGRLFTDKLLCEWLKLSVFDRLAVPPLMLLLILSTPGAPRLII